jgi:hypothetical protein
MLDFRKCRPQRTCSTILELMSTLRRYQLWTIQMHASFPAVSHYIRLWPKLEPEDRDCCH